MIHQPLLDKLGLNVHRYERVFGGDSNEAYCLMTGEGEKYFLKVNDSKSLPGLFEKEANGLKSLKQVSSLIIPEVIRYGVSGNKQYLLLEMIETGSAGKDSWEQFGSALAAMHRIQQPFFGWTEENYIGNLHQKNSPTSSWDSFYAECRIIPLVKKLFDNKLLSKDDITAANQLCQKLDQLFPPENPAFLHGDLWSGNFMFNQQGLAVLYDPAVYYGHREMDIGMTLLFGGFNDRFYASYNNTYPLEKGWQQRIALSQLYPILVHAVLFNGHYTEKVKKIINSYQ
jgi:fructosamine-3-kinase